MKQFFIRRVLPVALVVSLLIPTSLVSVSAVDFPDGFRDYDSVSDWTGAIYCSNTALFSTLSSILKVNANSTDIFWGLVNTAVREYGMGSVSEQYLKSIAYSYQSYFTSDWQSNLFLHMFDSNRSLASNTLARFFSLGNVNFEVQKHPSSGLYRIKETTNDIWVVDSSGRYPYYDPNETVTCTGWRPKSEVYKHVTQQNLRGVVVSQGKLEYLRDQLVKSGEPAWIDKFPGQDWNVIFNDDSIYCNDAGYPYFAYLDDNKAAVNQDRPTTDITDDAGNVLDDSSDVGIDIDNQFVLLPGDDMAITGEIIYDLSDHSYTVQTYDFETNNFEYNYTYEYYVQYTYVTYIGETSDFDAYKCYYELPDGRNSADLTKEELEQLNVGIDVVEYSRSTDDVRLRALYHFDGNTRDSSYWNHLSDFEWADAPSITYMESDPFGGALYLDGNVRSTLNFYLPTALGSGDFTIQFRYYQGQIVDEDRYTGLWLNAGEDLDEWWPSRDESAQCVLNFNGEKFSYVKENGEFNGIGESYPIGSWFEICLTRQGDTFTYYLNGQPLMVTDEYADYSFNDRILFFFYGGGDVAYSMIDELRVLNYAIASGKASYYEPTAVPHDTNLALVLPEDKVAYADEYWTFESSHANLLEQYGLADWTNIGYNMPQYLRPYDGKFGYDIGTGLWTVSQPVSFDSFDFFTAYYNTDVISLDFSSIGCSFDFIFEDTSLFSYLKYTLGFAITDQCGFPFSAVYIPLGDRTSCVLDEGDYVFSVVDSTGTICSVPFSIIDNRISASHNYRLNGYLVSTLKGVSPIGIDCLAVGFNPNTMTIPTSSIVYMELIRGTETDLTAEFHEDVAILDKDDQFKPTLAVKTDLDITDFQIGGVRPTIPEKGLVYALVESGYITSLQIYNGQAWEACDGRIWTGERWIPYSSYNVITLQDMYDIVDATPGYEYIYTEAGFWAWWQRTWNEFTAKLFSLLGSGTGTGDDGELDSPVEVVDPENEGILSFWEFIKLLLNGGKAVFSGFRQLFSGVVSMVPDSVESFTGALAPGGVAVSIFENRDPDFDVVAVWDLDSLDYYQTEEALDPWRYR